MLVEVVRIQRQVAVVEVLPVVEVWPGCGGAAGCGCGVPEYG